MNSTRPLGALGLNHNKNWHCGQGFLTSARAKGHTPISPVSLGYPWPFHHLPDIIRAYRGGSVCLILTDGEYYHRANVATLVWLTSHQNLMSAAIPREASGVGIFWVTGKGNWITSSLYIRNLRLHPRLLCLHLLHQPDGGSSGRIWESRLSKWWEAPPAELS